MAKHRGGGARRFARTGSWLAGGVLVTAAFAGGVAVGPAFLTSQAATTRVQLVAEVVATVLLTVTLAFQWWALRQQVETQRLQSLFLPYLTAFQAGVERLERGSLRGAAVVAEWARIVRDERMDDLADLDGVQVRQYARRVEVMLRVLEGAAVPDAHKEDCLALLRAQLSDDELVVLGAFANTHAGHSLKLTVDDCGIFVNAAFLTNATRRHLPTGRDPASAGLNR